MDSGSEHGEREDVPGVDQQVRPNDGTQSIGGHDIADQVEPGPNSPAGQAALELRDAVRFGVWPLHASDGLGCRSGSALAERPLRSSRHLPIRPLSKLLAGR